MKLLSANEIKEWDLFTIKNEPIASIDLMERASLCFTHWFISQFPNTNIPINIFSGNGNNGGDGLAIARLLRDRFYTVIVHIVRFAHQDSVDFDLNLSRAMKCGDITISFVHDDLPDINPNSIIIDALMGTGANKPANGLLGKTIDFLNGLTNKIISVDMPSGLPAEGRSIGPAVQAFHIFTFQLPKKSFYLQENELYCLSWTVGDIGLHPDYLHKIDSHTILIERNLIKGFLKERKKYQHKGNFGHALIIAGSEGKMGAAILAIKACLRSGAGLVTACIPLIGSKVMHESLPEAMVISTGSLCLYELDVDFQHYTIGIGPGLGKDDKTIIALKKILPQLKTPVVLDADALNILSLFPEMMSMLPKNSIITPHPKEFERLFGKLNDELTKYKLAEEVAKKYELIVVLKGAHTRVFTPDGMEYINQTGNPGMATAGSGDVLTGIITGLLAQGCLPTQASILGVYLHGLAGDLALKDQSPESLIAGDIVAHLGEAFKVVRS